MSWPSFYNRMKSITLVTSSGTNTSITTSKLVDSGATFITDNIQVGDHVKNTTDVTTATVTAVDSETTLSLSVDIFPTPSGDSYQVGNYNWGITTDDATDIFDAQAILVGSGGTSGVSVMKITAEGDNFATTISLLNNVIYEIGASIVHLDTTDGADIIILGNNK